MLIQLGAGQWRTEDGKTRTVDTALAALGEIERAVAAARTAITGKEA